MGVTSLSLSLSSVFFFFDPGQFRSQILTWNTFLTFWYWREDGSGKKKDDCKL